MPEWLSVLPTDSDSSDELDMMSEEELQAEALMFAGLMDFAGLKDIYLSYDDALEYAFQTSNHFEQAFSAQGIKQHSPDLNPTSGKTSRADLMLTSGRRQP